MRRHKVNLLNRVLSYEYNLSIITYKKEFKLNFKIDEMIVFPKISQGDVIRLWRYGSLEEMKLIYIWKQ